MTTGIKELIYEPILFPRCAKDCHEDCDAVISEEVDGTTRKIYCRCWCHSTLLRKAIPRKAKDLTEEGEIPAQ